MLRQAQHEDMVVSASPQPLTLSLSKGEPADG
jgi:hypothetical protein